MHQIQDQPTEALFEYNFPKALSSFEMYASEKFKRFIEKYCYGTSQINIIESINHIPPFKYNHYQNLVLNSPLNIQQSIKETCKKINHALSFDAPFLGYAYTHANYKNQKLNDRKSPLHKLSYLSFVVLNRIYPKISSGSYRHYCKVKKQDVFLLSKAEILGRLISSGFFILDYMEENGMIMFYVRKFQICQRIDGHSYWPIFKMNRIGKDGKVLKVYKFRTMYPYSEYLQELIFRDNGLDKSGKFKNDFRITRWGRFLRKYWLDELPMILNLLKGDIKLIGVRPISSQYLSMYPSGIKELRSKVKPGLLPPFYADLPKSFDEVVQSEKNYIMAYLQNPLSTDLKYFFKIIKNFLTNFTSSK